MRRNSWLSFFFGLMIWSTNWGHAQTITLSQAIGEAMDNSPEIAIAQKELDNVSLEEPLLLAIMDPEARAAASFEDDRSPRLLPDILGSFSRTTKLDLSITQQLLMGTEGRLFYKTERVKSPSFFKPIDPSVNTRLGVELSQPLLRHFWGRPDLIRREKARERKDQAKIKLKIVQEEIARTAAMTYLELYVAQKNIVSAEAALQDSQTLLETYKEKARYGLTQASDLIQTEVALKLATIELRLAQSEAIQAENNLKAILRDQNKTEPISANELPRTAAAPTETLDDLARQARTDRPEIKLAQKKVEEAQSQERLRKLEGLPQLALFTSYSWAGLKRSFNDSLAQTLEFQNHIASAGLEFQMPFKNKREKLLEEQARNDLEMARLSLNQKEDLAQKEVKAAHENLALTYDRVRLNQDLLDLEKKKLARAREDFDRGRMTTDAILRFQSDVHRAEMALTRSQADLLGGWINLWRATGSLLENLNHFND